MGRPGQSTQPGDVLRTETKWDDVVRNILLSVLVTLIPLSASGQQVICGGRLFERNIAGEGVKAQDSVMIFDGSEALLLEESAELLDKIPGVSRRDFMAEKLDCSFGDPVCVQSDDDKVTSYEIQYSTLGINISSETVDEDGQPLKLLGAYECIGVE